MIRYALMLITCYCVFVTSSNEHQTKKVLVDVNFNRFSRVHDGLTGLWTYYGVAKESHATQTEFAFNGDLIDSVQFHTGNSFNYNLASMTHPLLGLTSDANTDYLLYLILQAKSVGIDGFLVEWGYKGHQSDVVLKKIFQILNQREELAFTVALNWCEHWLKQHLGNASSSELLEAYYYNAVYLSQLLQEQASAFRHQGRLVVFLFGGGISSYQFEEVSRRMSSQNVSEEFLWIGNYLNMGSTDQLRIEWKSLLNGTFAWMSHDRTPSPGSFLDRWDFYTTPEDTTRYQKEVLTWAEPLVSSGDWKVWAASVNPGEDNRACAGWEQTLKFVPRRWEFVDAYQESWNNQLSSTVEHVVIVTFNDYSETTGVLPTIEHGFDDLLTTTKYVSLWKNLSTLTDQEQDENISVEKLQLPLLWFELNREVKRYSQVKGIDFENTTVLLTKTAETLVEGNYNSSSHYVEMARKTFISTYGQITHSLVTVDTPSSFLYPVGRYVMHGDAYVINSTERVSFKLSEDVAKILRNDYYRGMLEFDHVTTSSSHSVLWIKGSSQRSTTSTMSYSFFQDGFKTVDPDFGLIAEIHTPSYKTYLWSRAAVELFSENLDWSHGLMGNSDLSFYARDQTSQLLLRRVSLTFYIYTKKR